MLIGGLIGECLTEYYGAGTIYVEQFLKFKAPVRENDVVKIRLHNEIIQNNRVKIHILATVNDRNVVEGESVIIKGNHGGYQK